MKVYLCLLALFLAGCEGDCRLAKLHSDEIEECKNTPGCRVTVNDIERRDDARRMCGR